MVPFIVSALRGCVDTPKLVAEKVGKSGKKWEKVGKSGKKWEKNDHLTSLPRRNIQKSVETHGKAIGIQEAM
jgi:hypothetical protein